MHLTDLQAVLASRSHNTPGSRIASLAILTVLAAAFVMAVVASIVSPRWRRKIPRAVGLVAGGVLGIYLVGRGIAEFWTVDYSNPASYQHDWGGPSLLGVFAVHSGPGLAIVVTAAVRLHQRRTQNWQQ